MPGGPEAQGNLARQVQLNTRIARLVAMAFDRSSHNRRYERYGLR